MKFNWKSLDYIDSLSMGEILPVDTRKYFWSSQSYRNAYMCGIYISYYYIKSSIEIYRHTHKNAKIVRKLKEMKLNTCIYIHRDIQTYS